MEAITKGKPVAREAVDTLLAIADLFDQQLQSGNPVVIPAEDIEETVSGLIKTVLSMAIVIRSGIDESPTTGVNAPSSESVN